MQTMPPPLPDAELELDPAAELLFDAPAVVPPEELPPDRALKLSTSVP